MTREKVKEVMDIYRQFFIQQRIQKEDYPRNELLPAAVKGLPHCHGMLDKMEEFLKQGRREKAERWLCFIQGCLWSNGYFTIGQLADHNRS